jgi:hypothetical protein
MVVVEAEVEPEDKEAPAQAQAVGAEVVLLAYTFVVM